MPNSRFTLRPGQAILYGGLTVGVIDCAFATIRSAMFGTTFVKLWQGVASGALGAKSFEGGAATAALGLVFHFFIATSIVAFYYFLSRRFSFLYRHPFICGPIYGLGVYFFMNWVVIPLSAIGPQPHVLSRMWWGIGIHLVGIGLPAALFAAAVPRDG